MSLERTADLECLQHQILCGSEQIIDLLWKGVGDQPSGLVDPLGKRMCRTRGVLCGRLSGIASERILSTLIHTSSTSPMPRSSTEAGLSSMSKYIYLQTYTQVPQALVLLSSGSPLPIPLFFSEGSVPRGGFGGPSREKRLWSSPPPPRTSVRALAPPSA
jgi:hypothetical protein